MALSLATKVYPMEQTKPTYEELEARLAELQDRLEQAQQREADLCAAAERTKRITVLEAIMDHIPEGITIADRYSQMIIMESRYGLDLELKSHRQKPVPIREGLASMGMRRPDSKSFAKVEELPLWRATMNGEIVKEEEWLLVGRRKEPVTLMINAGPIRDSCGKITGGVAAWRDITMRKQLETALKQREEQFFNIFNINPDAVVIVCAESGRFMDVNDAFVKKMGYSREEALQMNSEKIWKDPEACQEFREIMQRQGECYDFETVSITKSGETRYCLLGAKSLKFSGRDATLVVSHDLTDHRRAEEALRQSEEKYRGLVETAAVLIMRTDREGRLVFLNNYAKNFFQVDDSALGKPTLDLFIFKDEATQALASGQAAEIFKNPAILPSVESKTLDKRGRTVWVDWIIRPITDEKGNTGELIGIGRDVTEKKLAEQALRRSEQQFRTLIESMPTLVWTLKPNGEPEFVNQRWVDYMGMSREEGSRWMEAVHPDDRPHTIESLKGTIEPGQFFEVEYRLRRKDGVYRWHLSRAIPLRDSDGKIFRWFGTSTDIHAHKMIEEDLRRIAAELERSNKELEEFAYVASHDLQEPLRMVTGYLQLIERRYRGSLDSDADEFIAFAVDGAARMQRLIADLLAYSRVSTKGHPLVPTDANKAFERARADLWTMIAETGATLTNDPLPVVNGDETQLAQLFLNLIGNAIKFRSEKPPEIHVGATPQQDDYLFYVRDNGVGFEPKYAARVFQVFQRLYTRQKYPGTGIGLAICKKIVDRHRGRIWVESEPGKGSTFYFTLQKPGGPSWT